jgi:hypothetical protein
MFNVERIFERGKIQRSSWGIFCPTCNRTGVVSAISPSTQTDNDQIFRSYDGKIYRILITRQMDYYNGQKVCNVYFIPKLHVGEYGDSNISVILGFVNVAARYRSIFIDKKSQLSLESFILEPDYLQVSNKIRQLVREILLIEEESKTLKLDQISAIAIYLGDNKDDLTLAKQLQEKWLAAREQLMTTAEKALATPSTSVAFEMVNKEWQAAMAVFRQSSEEVNSVVTLQALENLKKCFALSKEGKTSQT